MRLNELLERLRRDSGKQPDAHPATIRADRPVSSARYEGTYTKVPHAKRVSSNRRRNRAARVARRNNRG